MTFKRGQGKGRGGGTTPTPTEPAPTPDTTPAAFAFTAVTDAELFADVTSISQTITGIDAACPVSVSTGFRYSLDGGSTWNTDAGTIQPSGTLELQTTTGGQYSTEVICQVTVGTVTVSWSVTTEAAPAIPPEPAIYFGINTRSGYGGWPLGLEPASSITGTGASDWVINAAGELTPAGTYGAAMSFSKTAGQSYTLTFADAEERTITLVADEAHCAANSADTASVFQLKTYLQTAGFTGDIVCRDGRLNPTAALWRIRPPAAGYGGAITIRSENPTSGNDDHGNPIRGGGYSIGSITFDASLLAVIPVTFEDITFYNDVNDSTHQPFANYSSSAGRGVGYLRCRGENAATVAVANLKDGLKVRGATALQCAFRRVRKGCNGGLEDGAAVTRIAECVFREMSNDAVQLIGQNYVIEDNFSYDFLELTGSHPDGAQNYGINPINYTLPMIHRRNIWVMNEGVWYQGDFISDKPAPYWLEAVTVENEIFLAGYRGVTVGRGQGATVSNCLAIRMPGLAAAQGSAFIDVGSCTESTVDSCVSNAFTLGTSNGINNVTLAATIGAAQTAMPNFPTNVAAPGFTTRAAVIAACTPANLAIASGGFKKANGTYAGPLDAAGAYQ